MTRVIRIAIVVIGAVAIALAAFLPPILGAINWLFAWVIPVFPVFVLGLWWRRNTRVALVTLIVSWIINCVWTFTPLPAAIGGIFADLPNGYIMIVVSFVIFVVGCLTAKCEPGYFKVKHFEPIEAPKKKKEPSAPAA